VIDLVIILGMVICLVIAMITRPRKDQ